MNQVVFTEDQIYLICLNCHQCSFSSQRRGICLNQNVFLQIPSFEIFLNMNINTYSPQKLNILLNLNSLGFEIWHC